MENGMTTIIRILKDAIASADKASKEIHTKIGLLEMDVAIIKTERAELLSALQNQCNHPSSHRVDGMYMAGGYDHVSEQPYTIECDICAKVLESKLIRGTYA